MIIEWRSIPGFSRYEVSNIGDIRSHSRKYHGRLIKGQIQKYRFAILFDDAGNQKRVAFHKIVALTFLGPCPDGLEACHGDGNNLNNHVDNLRYATHGENMADKRYYDFLGYKARERRKANTVQKQIIKRAIYQKAIELHHSTGEQMKSLASRLGLSYWQLSRYNTGQA